MFKSARVESTITVSSARVAEC